MLRKLILLIAMISLFSLGFAVNAQDTSWTCGTVDPGIATPFSYTGWEGPGEVDKFTLAFDEFFEEYYPGVQQVPNTGVAWGDYWTTLPAQLAGGAEIDMIWLHDSRNDTFGENGWVLPLDSYLEACPPPGWPDSFVGTQIDAFNYNGSQYAIPYDWAPGGWYINVDLFEAAGLEIPTEETTWDEIIEMALEITEDTDGDGTNDVWGLGNLAGPGSGAGGLYWIVKSFGGEFWNEEINESHLNDEGTIEALQMVADLIWEHNVHPTADAVAATGFGAELMFANGNVAMHYALNDAASRFAELIGDDFNWTVAPTPTGPAGRFQFVGGSAFAIPSTAPNPDLAYELIRYTLSNPDHICRTAEMGSAYTSHLDFTGCVLPEDSPVRDAYEHTFSVMGAQDGVHPAYHNKYQEWESSVFISNFDLLWTGEERDAAAAAEAAHAQANDLLGE
jgi:multiple sugar transport system substrate-binding protein